MEKNDRLIKVVLAVRDGLTQIVEQLNDILGELRPPDLARARTPEPWIPHIDLSELDAAPWTTYHTKEPAEPGKAAWLKNPAHFQQFEPPKVVFELVRALQHSPNKQLQLGDMEYFFSGEEKFISRRPKKVKK